MMVSDLSSCSSLGLETRQRSNKYRSLSHTYKHPALLCRRLRLGCQATTRTYQPKDKPRIKICGVTNVSDAELVAKSGANFVGMIMWPKARRAVSIEISSQIADIARKHGAEPVAVFVDETFADIVNTCKSTGIKIAQLHGKESRKALQDLPAWLKVIYVLHARPDGVIQTGLVSTDEEHNRKPDWYLIDGIKGGSGETYDWAKMHPPEIHEDMQGWLLAGGLNPENVGQAITMLNPPIVDVSSGVTTPDGITKDPEKVFKFVEAVRRAALQLEQQN